MFLDMQNTSALVKNKTNNYRMNMLTLVCIKWVRSIFGDYIYLKKARKRRFHVLLHFNARKHMIPPFYLKWIEFTRNCEFIPL